MPLNGQAQYQLLPQYSHIENALEIFRQQDGTWVPNGAAITAMNAYIAANPIAVGANFDAAYLTAVINAAGNNGTAPANVGNAVATPAVVAAIAVADPIQTRIGHLLTMPQQYAHVRDALITAAIADGQWAPDANAITAMNAYIAANPIAVGANFDAAYLTAVINAAGNNGTAPANVGNAVATPAVAAAIAVAGAVQRRIASIKTEISKFSACPATATPELMNVIGSLPSDIQQSLVDNNSEKLKTFLSAKSPHDVFVAARTCGLDSSHFSAAKTPGSPHALEGLWDEIQRNQKHLKLHNSKIAEVLAEQSITLDRDSIKKWNEIILNKGADASKNCTVANFNVFAAALADSVMIDKKPLTARQRTDLINALTASQVDIIAQHGRNANIIAQLNAAAPPSAGSAATLRVLARIPKTNQLDNADITALTDAIKNAPTYEQFEKVVKAAAGGTSLNTAIAKIPTWNTVLTPESFTAIKAQYNHDKLIDKGAFDAEIKRQQAEIQKHREALASFAIADQATHEELERLTRLEALAWLNPETESIAHAHAMELSDQFEYLATVCDSMCRGLEAQRQAYQALADSFPKDEELQQLGWFSERGKVKKHRDEIKEDLAKIEEALGRYQLLHRRLYGDPTHDASSGRTIDNTIKKGILGVLQEAKQLKPLATPAKSSSGYQYEDFSDKSKLQQRIKDEYEDKPVPVAGALGVVKANPKDKGIFGNTGALKDNETRLHAKPTVAFVANPADPKKPTKGISASAYTEERGKEEVKSSHAGKKATQPITMTVVKYPTAIGNLDAKELEELKRAKVQFVTEMAADLLARLGKLPTPDDPIILRGNNEEQVGMLWTALVELGKAHPSYKFGADAIRVETMCFDPKGQKKWGGRVYKDSSYFEQYFKGATGEPLQKMQRSIRDFYTEGFGTEAQKTQAQQTKTDITSFYKKAIGNERVKKGFEDVSQLAPKKP